MAHPAVLLQAYNFPNRLALHYLLYNFVFVQETNLQVRFLQDLQLSNFRIAAFNSCVNFFSQSRLSFNVLFSTDNTLHYDNVTVIFINYLVVISNPLSTLTTCHSAAR